MRIHRLILVAALLSCLGLLGAQSTLRLNGLNEAAFVYRTVPDSLNIYFRDAFSFNFAYRDFSFGMKFVAELPKYSTNQSDLLEDLLADRLSLGWRELYASYSRQALLIHAGTIEESFGSGMVFRSFEDIEFDTDNRVTGFKFAYTDKLRLKALYGGIGSQTASGRLDLAYGIDAEYPVLKMLTVGGSALSTRELTPFNNYNQSDVFAGRIRFRGGPLERSAEYARRNLHRRGPVLPDIPGQALYANLALYLDPVQFGGAYKRYDQFQYRLQDLPVANHHSETLADNQATGVDEEGWQAWVGFSLPGNLDVTLDYAEAWNQDRSLRMNDAFAGLEWTRGETNAGLSYSQIEKLDTTLSHWQKESYPAFNASFPFFRTSLLVSGQFKVVDKQIYDVLNTYYEPKFQAEVALGKLGLSLGAESRWDDFSSVWGSRYWANLEAKYPLLPGTEIVLFVGEEAGGKVCRNGVCRYMAPFSGARLELSTRF